MKTLQHAHGGDLAMIEKTYHIPKEQILDFSGNINPLGFPPGVRAALEHNLDIVSTYPDKRYSALKDAIADYTGASPSHIVVGNGSTELISSFIHTIGAKKTLLLGPAYSEYEREAALAGGSFSYFALPEDRDFTPNLSDILEAITPDTDLLIACNPNNPTGSVLTVSQLEEILLHCKKNNAFVMIDETYIEFSDDLASICAIPLAAQFDNLFVIRGVSKFFAAPGLRLGYGISSNQAFLENLQKHQNPWSVNSLAAFAGERLFRETEFMQQTRTLILEERQYALKELSGWKNLYAYPSQANFILLRLLHGHIRSSELFEHLIRKKLLVRDAASFAFLDETFLRFCLRLPEENRLLLAELKTLVE